VFKVESRNREEGIYMCPVAKAVVYDGRVAIKRHQRISTVLEQNLDHPISSGLRLVVFVKGCTTDRSSVKRPGP
jgi:hypothetical protein